MGDNINFVLVMAYHRGFPKSLMMSSPASSSNAGTLSPEVIHLMQERHQKEMAIGKVEKYPDTEEEVMRVGKYKNICDWPSHRIYVEDKEYLKWVRSHIKRARA